MKYGELAKHLNDAAAGLTDLAPLYIVWGADDYLRANAVRLLSSLVEEDFATFNFSRFSDENAVQDALEVVNTYPVFGQYRVVVVKASQKLADADKESIKNYLQSPLSSSVFVLDCEGDAGTGLKLKGAQSVDCSLLEAGELANEIRLICKQSPERSIDTAAANELIERTARSMSRISSELVKLKAYCEDCITYKDVCDMVAPDLDFRIFELAGAVSEKNADRAFKILDAFRVSGIRSMSILNLLYDRYRKMLHAELHKGLSNDELGKLLDMKGGAVYYLRKASSGYSQVRLKRSVDYLHGLQYDVLRGKRAENSALQQAVIELLSL